MSTALNGSLIKALEILDLFSPARQELTAKQVGDLLDMNLATAHRFLLTLEHTGLLISMRRGRFELGQKLEDLGRLAFELNPLPRIAHPEVDRLRDRLSESIMACRLGRAGPTCVVAANSHRAVRISVDVGAVLPLATTAQGRIFLAFMPESERQARLLGVGDQTDAKVKQDKIVALQRDCAAVKEQGYAVNWGENEPEIGAIAVPVLSTDNRAILTLSMFGILSQIKRANLDLTLEKLTKAATRIAADYQGAKTNLGSTHLPDWDVL